MSGPPSILWRPPVEVPEVPGETLPSHSPLGGPT